MITCIQFTQVTVLRTNLLLFILFVGRIFCVSAESSATGETHALKNPITQAERSAALNQEGEPATLYFPTDGFGSSRDTPNETPKDASAPYPGTEGTPAIPLTTPQPDALHPGGEASIEFNVSGKVSSVEEDEGIPGVTVLVKGTSTGTVTDIDGKYQLTVTTGTETIVFSSIGYIPQEIPINNQSIINVALTPDVTQLEEMVVVGYGAERRADLTGSIASVSVSEKSNLANTNILQALQGEVPGLNIGAVGQPGENPSISIRGQNSITGDNTPLIVLDGVIFHGNLNDLNVNDIEKIDVLKDASAAAVFGSRSANGVLIITSKEGRSEKPQFNFQSNFGFNTVSNPIDMLDGEAYLQKTLDFRAAAGLEANPDNIEAYLSDKEVENLRNNRETNWFDDATRMGTIQEHQLSVSGRSNKTSYYIAGSISDQEGVALGDRFSRNTFRINIDNELTDWLSLGVKTTYAESDFSGIPVAMESALYVPPYGNYWANEELGLYDFRPTDDNLAIHPRIPLYVENESIRRSLFNLFSAVVNVPSIPGLTYTMNYNTNLNWDKEFSFFPRTTVDGLNSNGRAERNHREASTWTFDNILSYNGSFGDHSLSATLLFSRENRRSELTNSTAQGFNEEILGFNGLGLGETQVNSSGAGEDNSVAYMGRVNYKFMHRYLVTLTYRRDGYSAFGENSKYGSFPSAALGWVLSEENFLKNNSLFDFLKLRASYGRNGNQAIGRYQSLAQVENILYLFGDGGGTVIGNSIGTMANSGLGWETTTAVNAGIDFDMLGSRLSGDINYYNSQTEDMLLRRQIPNTNGFRNVVTNLGQINNWGVEVALKSVNVRRGEFEWTSGVAFSLNRNEIVSLYGSDANGDGIEDDDIGNSWFVGESLGAVFDYTTDGIYQLNEDIPFEGYEPGMVRLRDIAGLDGAGNLVMQPDGNITPEDRSIIGFEVPNYRWSLSNSFTYKRFNLFVFLNSIQGGGSNNFYIGENNRMYNAFFPDRLNLPVSLDYWTPNNPSEVFPALDYAAPRAHNFYEDRSFIRLQDVSLSYNFGEQLLNKLRLTNLNLFASGKNLATWTNWSGYDPEMGTSIGDFPMLRSYVLGFTITF